MSKHTTTEHADIKDWAEERNATPVIVTNSEGEATSIVRFELAGNSEELREVDWGRFFDIFDSNGLQFLYDEESNFNTFINSEEE